MQKRTLLAVLGGVERKGAWRVPRHLRVIAVLGGGELDLREAEIGPDGVDINAFCLLGGLEVTVRSDDKVELSGTALAGGNELMVHPTGEGAGRRIGIRAVALLGGVSVHDKA